MYLKKHTISIVYKKLVEIPKLHLQSVYEYRNVLKGEKSNGTSFNLTGATFFNIQIKSTSILIST